MESSLCFTQLMANTYLFIISLNKSWKNNILFSFSIFFIFSNSFFLFVSSLFVFVVVPLAPVPMHLLWFCSFLAECFSKYWNFDELIKSTLWKSGVEILFSTNCVKARPAEVRFDLSFPVIDGPIGQLICLIDKRQYCWRKNPFGFFVLLLDERENRPGKKLENQHAIYDWFSFYLILHVFLHPFAAIRHYWQCNLLWTQDLMN